MTERSPQFASDGHQGTCSAFHNVHIRAYQTTYATVYCVRY